MSAATDSVSRSERRYARRYPKRLSDIYRTAFVTGASTGLGAAFAQMLLDEGVQVWGTARELSRLQALAAANRGRSPFLSGAPLAGGSSVNPEGIPHPTFTPVVLDLADGAAAERAFREAEAQAGGFDIVINNAGYSVFGDFAQTDFAHWQAQIEAMLINTARIAHAALKSWNERGDQPAALVNVSSLAVEFSLPFQAGYNVVKAGLSALSESLMVDTAGTSVRVIDLRPGDYRTDFESSVRRPEAGTAVGDAAATQTGRTATASLKMTPSVAERQNAVWGGFSAMMGSGPPPEHAAQYLRRALLRRRRGTLRCGRFFQVVLAPFLVRFASLGLKRRVQALYFGL